MHVRLMGWGLVLVVTVLVMTGCSEKPETPTPALTDYTLTVVNTSTVSGDLCLYQTDSRFSPPVQSLAWITAHTVPRTAAVLHWTTDRQFVWAEAGQLAPGAVFAPSQIWQADPRAASRVALTYQNRAFRFVEQSPGTASGSLTLSTDDSIPAYAAAVGIGMSGLSAFAVPAQANMTVTVTPQPRYWLAVGAFRQGEVLDPARLTAVEVAFPPRCNTAIAILQPDASWAMIYE